VLCALIITTLTLLSFIIVNYTNSTHM